LQSIVQPVFKQNVSLSLSAQTDTKRRLPSTSATTIGVPSLLDEAWRLEAFVHPFTFSAFFSPEDTLLCVCAADAARDFVAGPRPRITELTSGSGLVGFYLLRRDPRAKLLGLDIDAAAAQVAEGNARLLGLGDRSRFIQSDLWSAATQRVLEAERSQLLVCNPPYVPEPPGTHMQIEAGAGPHGTAHLLRALELARSARPDALALSWCSLADPAGIVDAAERAGYSLHELYVTAIADGEYSGSVHAYLRALGDCYINEQRETLDIIAPDSSARFAYLLFAGAFRPGRGDGTAAHAIRTICESFAAGGVGTLANVDAPLPVHCSMLTRRDELELRVMLHGPITRPARGSA
jgi:release factor glutamine methyltransferase